MGRPFLRATNIANGARKGVYGNYFHEPTLAELFTIHMNLHVMEFLLIFSETNFVEVPKSTKFMALKKKHPTVSQVFINSNDEQAYPPS